MKTISKNSFRLFGLASLLTILIFSLSCEKDEPEMNNPKLDPILPLMASADVNFVTEGKAYDFKDYSENVPTEINISIVEDTSMVIYLESKDQYGKDVEGPFFSIFLNDSDGFQQGDLFTFPNTENELTHIKIISDGGVLYFADGGEFRITSISQNHIKAEFECTGNTQISPEKEVIVTNGKIDSYFIRIQ